jgi:deoxyribodipyrimidine photolyase-related protein
MVSPEGRRWVYVPYDQLNDGMGPLASYPAEELAIVLIENPSKAARRPYHRQKLAWVLLQQRQFALEQAARGVHVHYAVGDYLEVLSQLGQPCLIQQPAERELRQELQPLVKSGQLQVLPHQGWLTTSEQFLGSQKGPPWRMDAFYRRVRQDSGILMEKGKPVGGKYSFDAENRQPWKGQPPAPQAPTYERCELRREVEKLILEKFADHPGHLDTTTIPVTLEEIQAYWQWVCEHCLAWFGPYEDAMSVHSSTLFHSRLSPLINLHRLLPRQVVQEALQLDIPLACKEGFVRQILGWREFVYHVHVSTDGFRQLSPPPVEPAPEGDGGWSTWSGRQWPGLAPSGSNLSWLGAQRPLPKAFWGQPSGLKCLDQVVSEVWRDGWSHHITRLMILSNLATLLDLSPRQLTDWFWVAYIDAYEWVVEPNVLGMGSYATGPLMTTKPYVSGSAYIDRMSDYCQHCQFHPKNSCPITSWYWAFLGRHHERLKNNQRMSIVLKSWQKRTPEQKQRDQEVFEEWSTRLQS